MLHAPYRRGDNLKSISFLYTKIDIYIYIINEAEFDFRKDQNCVMIYGRCFELPAASRAKMIDQYESNVLNKDRSS